MITPSLARMLAQEHRYRKISGRLLTLGRQLVCMTHEEALGVLRDQGIAVPLAAIERTRGMIETRARFSEGRKWITDQAFFLMLGIEESASIDVANYEGCDIVHNQNLPIPNELVERYDFIIDGGTFDHLVDLRICFQNVIRLLKPGGRVFQWNAASSFTGAAYLSFGPDLFHDFFVVNRFADCKTYVAEGDNIGQRNWWNLYFLENPLRYAHFPSPRVQMTLVIAEKAEDSTWEKLPVQSFYRDTATAVEYELGLNRCRASSRPVWQGRFPALAKGPRRVFPPCLKCISSALLNRARQTGMEILEWLQSPERPEQMRKIGRQILFRLEAGMTKTLLGTGAPPREPPAGFRYVGKF
jgi:SAM-dependent methyltransferase